MASWFGSKDNAGPSAMEVSPGCRAALACGRGDIIVKLFGIGVPGGLGGL